MEIIVLVVVLAVLVVGGATFAVSKGRNRGPELEPPRPPRLKPSGGGATAVEDRVEDIPADLVQQVEEALAEVEPEVDDETVVELEPGIDLVEEPEVEVEPARRPGSATGWPRPGACSRATSRASAAARSPRRPGRTSRRS